MDVTRWVEHLGESVEVVGVLIIVAGVARALATQAMRAIRSSADADFASLRRSIGRSILLGLEVLVAGDIIRTVALEPTFESVGVLATIVVIRTFLSFSLEVELTGSWPWNGAATSR